MVAVLEDHMEGRVTRRHVLTAAGAVAGLFAGCTKDDSLDDSDWQQLHRWLEASRFTITDARFKFQQWFDAPDSVPSILIELLHVETEELLLEYREEVDPLTFELPEGTITVSGDGWGLNGDDEQISLTVRRVGMVLGAVDNACEQFTAVNGDPDALESRDEFDRVIDEGGERLGEIEEIVVTGRLDQSGPH
ncbi:hypothetical protein [Halobiforma nitratireducens]|nr:hypothetical protein [Halobiforma nitratireducens]